MPIFKIIVITNTTILYFVVKEMYHSSILLILKFVDVSFITSFSGVGLIIPVIFNPKTHAKVNITANNPNITLECFMLLRVVENAAPLHYF